MAMHGAALAGLLTKSVCLVGGQIGRWEDKRRKFTIMEMHIKFVCNFVVSHEIDQPLERNEPMEYRDIQYRPKTVWSTFFSSIRLAVLYKYGSSHLLIPDESIAATRQSTTQHASIN